MDTDFGTANDSEEKERFAKTASSCSPRPWLIPQAFIGSLPNLDGTGTSKYLAAQEVNGR